MTTDLSYYDSIRVHVKENIVKPSNLCFFIWTLFLSSVTILPLIWLCTDCWKKMAFRLTEVRVEVYHLLQQVLHKGKFSECFISLDDSYLDEEKVENLAEGMGNQVVNFVLINRARNFNAKHNNADAFPVYAKVHLGHLKNVECVWEKTFFTSQQRL